MDQIKKLYTSLTLMQKIAIGVALILVGTGISFFIRWQHDRDFKPLFTGMSPEDAAAVVQKLKEGGVEHRLTENGAGVLVPSQKVDEVRLELAGAGLPKSGRIGFELFDKTNLGVTDFGEKINYRRALEGELERTVKTINGIDSARVHITFPKDSVFLDAREPAKASVLVKLRPGAALRPQNVVAIGNLLASAVEGLSPDAVSIVDMQGNLLSKRRNTADGVDSGDALLDYRHQVEKDLAAKVEATLEPLLGEGHFRVGVSADCDISTSEQTDETYDPTRSVMSNSQKTEDVSSNAQPVGPPGTPSNLPRSAIKPLAASGGSNGTSRRTESIAFETSRSVRQVKVPRGAIKRISAAVLLDQELQWQGAGGQRKRALAPPTPERMKAIHDIVAGALGAQAERGDQVVIESLPFEQTRQLEETVNAQAAAAAKPQAPAVPLSLAALAKDRRFQIGAGAGVALLAALVFLLMRRKKAAKVGAEADPKALAAAAHGDAAAAKSGESDAQAVAGNPPVAEIAAPARIEMPEISSATKILLSHIQEHVNRDPAFASGIVRAWLDED